MAKPTKPTIEGVGFNASSINLFNEDIEAIFNSNGLIGIALDQRVLGYSELTILGNEVVSDNILPLKIGAFEVELVTDTEFVSLLEIEAASPYKTKLTNGTKLLGCVQKDDVITQNSTDIKDFFHPRQFYLHIVHAMQVAAFIGQHQGDTEAAVRKC
ncbi:MAG: hypothetical protein R2822_05235 [Spirosomataceae bacterium]